MGLRATHARELEQLDTEIGRVTTHVNDWYVRYVISWVLDETLELPFVRDAVDQVLTVATPTICNSDQESH